MGPQAAALMSDGYDYLLGRVVGHLADLARFGEQAGLRRLRGGPAELPAPLVAREAASAIVLALPHRFTEHDDLDFPAFGVFSAQPSLRLRVEFVGRAEYHIFNGVMPKADMSGLEALWRLEIDGDAPVALPLLSRAVSVAIEDRLPLGYWSPRTGELWQVGDSAIRAFFETVVAGLSARCSVHVPGFARFEFDAETRTTKVIEDEDLIDAMRVYFSRHDAWPEAHIAGELAYSPPTVHVSGLFGRSGRLARLYAKVVRSARQLG